MKIEKQQRNPDNFLTKTVYNSRARDVLKDFLASFNNGEYRVFLPAFIGVSPKEGSGLYDPICELKIKHTFYAMKDKLEINVDDLFTKIEKCRETCILLLVHYWGYVDPQYHFIAVEAKKRGCIVIEDMAHAVYTEYVDGTCGQLCDASFYSLHKMFPLKTGGALKIKNRDFFSIHIESRDDIHFPFEYDMYAISKKRKENANTWENLIQQNQNWFEIIRPASVYGNCTPQTFPVILKQQDRFRLYQDLNEEGFGIVSLYHTMINPIKIDEFQISLDISQKILNLPVHQDIDKQDIEQMYSAIISLLNSYQEQK